MSEYKIKHAHLRKVPVIRQYQDLVIGNHSLWFLIKFELITLLFGQIPGALGLFLRKWTYPWILGKVGKGVIFGHHMTLRHPQKIRIGDGTIIDDYVVLDAKGENNQGITIGEEVFIGRNSILYCKDGDMILEKKVNIGHRSILFSSHQLVIGEGTLIAADCYLMSGGNYDHSSNVSFAEQDGTFDQAPLTIGKNCWLGAKVVVLDTAGSIGNSTVVGAGAVVTQGVPEKVVAVGIPARVVKRPENGI